MKSQIKLLCVALIVILSISLCTLHVFATPNADPLTDETTATVSTEAPPVVTDPPTDPVTEPPTEATTAPTTAATTAPTTADSKFSTVRQNAPA